MTKVYLEEDKGRYLIEATEHTDAKVCSAVSSLLYAIAGWLLNEVETDTAVEVESNRIDSGYALIAFSGGERCKAVFDLAVIGFLQLEASYSEHIQVRF